jgi:hypothetical protein
MAVERLELELGTDVLLLETGDALLLESSTSAYSPSATVLIGTKVTASRAQGHEPQLFCLACWYPQLGSVEYHARHPS